MEKRLILVCAFFISCARQDVPELIVVSPHPPEIRREFGEGFSGWYQRTAGRAVRVRWLDVGGTSESVEYIKSRNDRKISAGGVDVFFGGGDVPFFTLSRLGLLAPCGLPDSVIRRMPRELSGVALYSQDSLWYGAALSSFGVLCNLRVAEENHFSIPRTWEDLAGPELKGWIAMGDPRYSGTMHVMYEIILQTYGWEKGWEIIFRMAANSKGFLKGANQAAKAVSLGQTAFGLSVDFYAFAEIERYGQERLRFVLPESLSIITPDGIGMLKNGGQPQAARAFIEYVMTEGQKLWMFRKGTNGGPAYAALCRMSADTALYRTGAEHLVVTANPFSTPAAKGYDGRLTGRRWLVLNDLAGSFLIIPHTDLAKAAGRPLCMPVSEKEVAAFSAGWADKGNAAKRLELMKQWQAEALRMFRERE